MRKAEGRLWDTMKRQRPAGVFLQRLEDIIASGIPDVMIMSSSNIFPYAGKVTFTELKAPKRPKRGTSLLFRKGDIRTTQIGWLRMADALNIPAYLLIRDDTGSLYLIPGGSVPDDGIITLARTEELSVASNWDQIWDKLL